MGIMNIIMMGIINMMCRCCRNPRRVPESEIRNEAPRDDEAGRTGSLAPEHAGTGEGKPGNKAALNYRVFAALRPGRDVAPDHLLPGKQSLIWIANSATLIYGGRDAVLVDTFMTVEQCSGLADAIVASGKTLKAIYVTHGHPDHFFGLKVLQDRFPNAQALATREVVAKMRLQITPEKLDDRRKQFPGLPEIISIADPLEGNEIDLEGNKLIIVKVGHTDTDDTTCLHVPSIGLVVAGDVVYNGIHPFLGESNRQTRLEWIAALDKIDALRPSAVVAGHKIPATTTVREMSKKRGGTFATSSG